MLHYNIIWTDITNNENNDTVFTTQYYNYGIKDLDSVKVFWVTTH